MLAFAGRIAGAAVILTALLATMIALLKSNAASGLRPPSDTSHLQIVYRAFTGEEAVGSAYVMNVEGGDVQPLAFESRPFYQFSCSGDGTHLAFIDENQLYTMAVGDDAPRAVGGRRQGLLGISLSGDGSKAALLTVQDQSLFVVWLLDMTTGDLTRLMETAMQLQFIGVASVTLSPDAQRILFEKPAFRYNLNNTYSLIGAEMLEFDVANPSAQRELGPGTSPALSPDSRVIAYGNGGGLTLRDRATGIRWMLRPMGGSVYGSGGIWGPAWSPDGSLIAAWSYLDLATIFVTDLNGHTGPARQTNGQRQVEPCFLLERPEALLTG
jgi:Tol biopolymer transport system component